SVFVRFTASEAFVGKIFHSIRIDNLSPYETAHGKLTVPLIKNETARHYVVLSNISSYPSLGSPRMTSDDSENLYASWEGISISGRERLTVTLEYLVCSFATKYLVNLSYSTKYENSLEIYAKYTAPEYLIQSDNAQIILTAQNITANVNTTAAKVSKIYDFVVKHLTYEEQYEEKGALWALANKKGDCSEYSYLFTALCRASGIPARVKAGFAFHFSSETTENGHMWAEYYIEDYGWVPVDATWKQFNALDNKHFCSLQSYPELKPYANYYFTFTRGYAVEETQTVTIRPASTSVFGDDSLVANLSLAIQKMNEAETILTFGRLIGASWVVPTQNEESTQSLWHCNILLQETVEKFDAGKTEALLAKAQDAAQQAWSTVFAALLLYLGFAALFAVVVLVALTLSQVKRQKPYRML
ncbi:MAG: transglutaminase-like domain-containing protein, partial [Candidatus Bathyarchaeia archaeon]